MGIGTRGNRRTLRQTQRLMAGIKSVVEGLESRTLFSVAYDSTVLAQTGAGGVTAISSDVSLNDNNAVAFQATTTKDVGVFAGDGTASFPVHEINPGVGTGGNSFSPYVQIRSGAIVARSDFPAPRASSFHTTSRPAPPRPSSRPSRAY